MATFDGRNATRNSMSSFPPPAPLFSFLPIPHRPLLLHLSPKSGPSIQTESCCRDPLRCPSRKGDHSSSPVGGEEYRASYVVTQIRISSPSVIQSVSRPPLYTLKPLEFIPSFPSLPSLLSRRKSVFGISRFLHPSLSCYIQGREKVFVCGCEKFLPALA